MPRHVELPPELQVRPFAVAAARQSGITTKRLRARDLERPFHGVRSVESCATSVRSRCEAYRARMQEGFAFSHVTAAALWGIPLPAWVEADIRIHVSSVDGKERPRLRGVIGHELSDKRMRVTTRSNLPVVDAVTTWLQLAAMLPFDDLVTAGDHLVLTPRRCDPADPRPYVGLETLADRVHRFRGRGRRSAVLALPLIRNGSESPKESVLRLQLQARNLPEPEVNGAVFSDDGVLIGYGDLVYRTWKVIVEYDGEHHRVDSRQYYRDIERHEGFVRANWIQIRETKETPPTGPRSTLARTEAALRSRGWRP